MGMDFLGCRGTGSSGSGKNVLKSDNGDNCTTL